MIQWSNQAEFLETLRRYTVASRKSLGDVIANESKWFSIGLQQEFSKESPTPESIAKGAAERKFRMGRKSDSITTAERGVSHAAMLRARSLLDGQKSDWFKVTLSADGTPVIKRARFSAKNGNKLLRGGRWGNKFAKSALRASQLEADNRTITQVLRKDLGLKQLNERALANAMEIGYRARAAKGHLMGVQWLPEVYKKRSSSVVKRGPLVANTRNGKRIGIVEFSLDAAGEVQTVTITGMVPGTRSVAGRSNIVERVAAARIADRRAYIARKMAEAKRVSGVLS